MNRTTTWRTVATSRRVLAVFVALVAVPTVLAANSFRPFVPVPDASREAFEAAFRLTVFHPVDLVRSILFEPLGLGVLFTIPIVRHVVIVVTLVAIYYAVSVGLVTAWTAVRDAIEE